MSNPPYIGTRWYKCDLHLHTPASLCFRDRDSVTADEWVQACLAKDLGCVAVTDHNTGAWIDQIKIAAEGIALTIFPGVEITCSDAKVHLLVLFDTDKGSTEVNDFLIRAGIDREMFGKQEAHSPQSIMEIAELAQSAGGICIPAHVDEFNGLCEVGNQPRMEFLKAAPVLGVQVVHPEFLLDQQAYSKAGFQTAVASKLANYYGKEIQSDRMNTWRQAALQSREADKAILTFSDNPHAEGDSKHGLWGIGTRYAWIKMEAQPNLESLVQALLIPGYRIRNDFDCPAPQLPYHIPDTWLKKITITRTRITGTEPMEVEFSPQMNTIVGGRGSGKSSVLRFLRGFFPHCQEELTHLTQVKEDFEQFFRPSNKEIGVLENDSILTLEVHRNGANYQLVFQQEKNQQKLELFKWNPAASQYQLVEDPHAIRRFELDLFAQRQIFDIATQTNSLRDRIDQSNPEIQAMLEALQIQEGRYLEQGAHVRSLEEQIAQKVEVRSKIQDSEQRITMFSQSGTADLLRQNERFGEEHQRVETFRGEWRKGVEKWEAFLAESHIPQLETEDFDPSFHAEMEAIKTRSQTAYEDFVGQMKAALQQLATAQQETQHAIEVSTWQAERNKAQAELVRVQAHLKEQGIPVMEMQEEIEKKNQLQVRLAKIEETEQHLIGEKDRLGQMRQAYLLERQKLSALRGQAVKADFSVGNVRIKVKPCRDFGHFERGFRLILGTERLVDDVQALLTRMQRGRPDQVSDLLVDNLSKIRAEEEGHTNFGRRFITKLQELSGEAWDRMTLLHPEDDIVVEYKPNSASPFKPISTASPGQKTAAILTLILSQGSIPLILDQPEDDLDNSLIYQLVVEQLRQSKENRQIIVVTHNANIPVNGDSEHIVVMNGETSLVSPMVMGPLENPEVKQAICDIMEGGTKAFEMRSRRYAGLGIG